MNGKKCGFLIGMLLIAFTFLTPVDINANNFVQTNKAKKPNALPLNPDIKITLTPHNPPVTLPVSGGNVNYSIEVTNNELTAQNFDVWAEYTASGGVPNGPIAELGPFSFLLPEGWSTNRALSHRVPGNIPSGIYTYKAYVGKYPYIIWDSDSFTFEKLPPGGWYAQNSGTTDFLYAVEFPVTDVGWAVGLNSILHTIDGGDNWYPQASPTYYNYFDVDFVDTQTGWVVGGFGTILHTKDGGYNWVLQDSGYPYGSYHFEGVHFVDANNGWAVGGKPADFTSPKRLIVHTSDGGEHWETQLFQYNKLPLNDVFFTDVNNGWAVGDGDVIFHTKDGGANWYPQDPGTQYLYLRSVFFIDADMGWIADNYSGTVLHTTDGGDTWTSQYVASNLYLTSVVFIDAQTGWVAGGDNEYGRVFHTIDGGNTWQEQDIGDTLYLGSIFFIDATNGWTTGWDGTIIHTETGGE